MMKGTINRCMTPLMGAGVITVMSLCNCPGSGHGFRAQGTITRSDIRMDGQQLKSSANFIVARDGCEWSIKTWISSSTNGIKYNELGCDGTNIHAVIVLDTNISGTVGSESVAAPLKGREPARSAAFNTANAVVMKGQFPIPTQVDVFATPVWLALASGCYFESITNSKVHPPYPMGPLVDANKYRVNANWSWLAGAERIPEKIVYFAEGKVFGPQKEKVLSPPYNNGYTGAIYEVTAKSLLPGGSQFPLEFRFTRFAPKADGTNASDLRVTEYFTGRIENFEPDKTSSQFVPNLPEMAIVRDKSTVTTNGGYVYVSSNGSWMGASEISNRLQSTSATAGKRVPNESTRRTVVVLFIGTSICLAVLLLKFLRRTPK